MQRIRSFFPRAIPLLGVACVAGLGIAIATAQNQNQPAQPRTTTAKPAADQAAQPANRNQQAGQRIDRPQAGAQRAAGLGVQFQGQGDQGLQVANVDQNSAFAQAGLRQNDRIVSVDGMTFNSPRQLDAFLYSQTGPVSLIIDRGGQRYSIQVAMPAATTDAAWLGVYLEESEEKAEGAKITQVYPVSPAARAGLQPGDIITQINDQKVAGTSDVVMIVREFQPQAQVQVDIVRDKEQMKVPVILGSRRESFLQHHQQFAGQQPWEQQGAYQAGYQAPQQGPHQQFGPQHWSQNGRPQGGSGSNFEGIPHHAMQLEHQRREAEQHERIEEEIRLLREEVKKLREELRK